MGYDAHITRKEFWFEEEGKEIALQEWLDFIASDPTLKLGGQSDVELPDGGKFGGVDPSLAVWTGWSGHGKTQNMAWIWHSEGCIVMKNPYKEMRIRMHEIAMAFDAKVQGDDGEFYDENGDQIKELGVQNPWWKFW